MSSKAADLRIELSFLKDNVVEACGQGRTAVVENGLDVYEELVATFIDVLSQFGSPYSREQALAEMQSFEGRWSEIEWVRDDYREIADAAFASHNFSVLLPVVRFPVRLCIAAYAKRDYYVFAKFLNWLSYLYDRAVDDLAPHPSADAEPDARHWLFYTVRDRLAEYLRELASYRVGPDIADSLDPNEIERSADFARWTFVVFSKLLKRSYERGRAEDFLHFASELQRIYRHEVDRYTGYGGVPSTRPVDQSSDEPVRPIQEVRQLSFERLTRLRQIIFLGLDAWMLRDYEREKRTREDIQLFRGGMYLPSSITELWLLYLEARAERYETELDWTWWESEEHRGEDAYSGMDFGLLLLRPTALRMLVSASSMPADTLNALHLEPSRDLDYLVGDGSGPLGQTLGQIAASEPLRELSPFDPEVAPALRERFLAARREQADIERRRLIEAPLSPERVENLKRSMLRGWVEGGYLRSLMQQHGAFVLDDEAPAGLQFLSVHKFDPKDLYVEPSRFSDRTWGVEYGRALGRGEDEGGISQMASAVESLAPGVVDPAAIVGYLEEALQASGDIRDPIILIAGSLSASWALAESSRFEYSRHVPDAFGAGDPLLSPSGFFDGVPVFQFHTESERVLLVADLRRLGTWHQYRPAPRSEITEYIDDVLLFELEAYSEDSARRLLENQPDVFRLDAAAGRERSYEERISLLLTHVRVLVLEQFRYDVLRPEAGRVVRFTE
jgi:hypothetical protein